MTDEQKLADRAAKVKASMARAQGYIKAMRGAEVYEALSQRDISQAAFRLWKKNPEKLITAYKCNAFLEAIATLPDLEAEKKNNAYTFALGELGVGREAQRELTRYRGVYELYHDFSELDLRHLAVSIENQPFLAMFAFKYFVRQHGRGFCDGLIVTKNGRMVLAGFSRTTIFQAAFRSVAYPDHDIIKGIGLIDDFETGTVQISKLALIRHAHTSEAERTLAKAYVQESVQQV